MSVGNFKITTVYFNAHESIYGAYINKATFKIIVCLSVWSGYSLKQLDPFCRNFRGQIATVIRSNISYFYFIQKLGFSENKLIKTKLLRVYA